MRGDRVLIVVLSMNVALVISWMIVWDILVDLVQRKMCDV